MYKTVLILIGFLALGPLAQAQNRPPLRPVVPGCPVCDLWSQYEGIVLEARQEIGKLPNGVVYLHYGERPAVIEPLIQLAYERAELLLRCGEDPALAARLGGACGHNLTQVDPDLTVEISPSVHGFFVILTSPTRTTVKIVHQDAKRSVQLAQPVKF